MWRSKYHISPPYGLLNDPNGLIYWKDEFHIFYQWNPEKCEHGAKSWGHLKSKDLINWEKLPVALEPKDWFDKNGCYSGSAIEKDGKLYLFYTGNVKNDGIRESYQCLAISEDGITFEKKGVVIDNKDIPQEYTKHFRDPKVFKDGDIYKMVLGAQRENLTGTVVVYISEDLINWRFEKEIIKGDFGYMCECPDYINIDNQGILLFSPQGLEPLGDLYNNRFQSGYILRDLYDNEKNNFIELDRGFEFYAPQTTVDNEGKIMLIGWLGMPDELEHPTVEKENWIHMLTLPRTLSIRDGKLYQQPHKLLEGLRKDKKILNNLKIKDCLDLKEYGIFGKSYEMILKLKDLKSDFEIKFRVGNGEESLFKYNFYEKKAILNREKSGEGYKGERRVFLDTLKEIRMYVDISSVEIFLNDGEEVFTANIYPSEESDNIQIISKEETIIEKLEFYNI